MARNGQWDELSNEVVTPFLRGHDRTRKEIWDYTFDDIYSDSHARVVTCKGDIIEGEIIQWGDTVQKRDLLIVNPEVVTFSGNGETEPEHPLGKYAYVHEQDISHIALNEDLNEGDESVAKQEVEEGKEEDETESVARDDLMDEYAQEIARREGYESVDDLLKALDIDTVDELLDTDIGHPIPEEDRE